MKRTFTKYPRGYVRASNYGDRSRYAPTMRDDTIYKDLPWIAGEIAKQLDYWTRVFGHDCYTVESAIEAFVMMNDDYDDWWARGLNTREKEQKFMNELLLLLKHRGIEEVEDNTFT